MAEFDDRTERNLATLLPEAQEQAREFLRRLPAAGISAKILGGTRTYAEQDALYAQGRTTPGHIVTHAKGGESNHNFGIAWDLGIFHNHDYLPDSPLYDVAGAVGERLGLEWGGHFNTITDKPHFQCKTGLTLAELRHLHDTHGTIPINPLDINKTVSVYNKNVKVNVPALYIDHRTWVGLRAMTDVFGGHVTQASGSPLQITLELGDKEHILQGQSIEGTGYVKFADFNAFYNLNYQFKSVELRLDII